MHHLPLGCDGRSSEAENVNEAERERRSRRRTLGVFFSLNDGAAVPELPQRCYHRFDSSRVGLGVSGWGLVIRENTPCALPH